MLTSAVVKIARAMRLPAGLELYRGLGGYVDLPESFFKADDNGCSSSNSNSNSDKRQKHGRRCIGLMDSCSRERNGQKYNQNNKAAAGAWGTWSTAS